MKARVIIKTRQLLNFLHQRSKKKIKKKKKKKSTKDIIFIYTIYLI